MESINTLKVIIIQQKELQKIQKPKKDMVVYRRLYDDGGLWVRPKEMF